MCLGTAYTQQNLERPLLGWSFTVAEIKYLFLHVNSKAASKCQVSYSICYCCCNKCWVSTTKFLTDLLLSTLPSKSFPPQWREWLSNAVYSFMRFLFFQTNSCLLQALPPPFSFPKHYFTSSFLSLSCCCHSFLLALIFEALFCSSLTAEHPSAPSPCSLTLPCFTTPPFTSCLLSLEPQSPSILFHLTCLTRGEAHFLHAWISPCEGEH